MALKAVKCPSCGGDLSLDDEREFGFCQYCGTKVMLHETINVVHSGTVQLDTSGKVKNRMKLARNAYEDGKYQEAYEHYTNVLEDEPEQCEALTRRGICAAYMTRISNINCNELTRGYKEAITILEKRIKNSSSEEEKEGHKKQLQDIINDMTNFVTNINRSFQNAEIHNKFLDMQSAANYQKALINFIYIIDTINRITPSGYENNLKVQYRIQYELCNIILSVNIGYISGYKVNKYGAREAKYTTLPLNGNTKQQIIAMRQKAIESYNNLPTFKAALEDLSNTLKKNTDEKQRIEKELQITKAAQKDAIAKFWNENPSLYKNLKAKKWLTWIAIGIGILICLILWYIGRRTNFVYINLAALGILVLSIYIKVIISKKVQKKYEDSVFPAEIKDTIAKVNSLSAELNTVNNQIFETNRSIYIYKQNNFIG